MGEAAHDAHAEHLSATPLLVGLGALLLYLAAELRGPFLVVGVAALGGAMLLWVREDVRYWRENRVDHGAIPGRDLDWWGMVWFLGTEVMLFASLFAAFFVARHNQPAEWAAAHEHLAHAVPLVTVNTLILVASGATAHFALHAIQKGMRQRFLWGLGATLALGTLFLGLQANEYATLVRAGIDLSSGPFASVFYVLTGTHGFHVLLGLVFFAVVLVRALKGQFSPTRHVAMDAFTVYWHFVDVVWILLYLIVYLGVV